MTKQEIPRVVTTVMEEFKLNRRQLDDAEVSSGVQAFPADAVDIDMRRMNVTAPILTLNLSESRNSASMLYVYEADSEYASVIVHFEDVSNEDEKATIDEILFHGDDCSEYVANVVNEAAASLEKQAKDLTEGLGKWQNSREAAPDSPPTF